MHCLPLVLAAFCCAGLVDSYGPGNHGRRRISGGSQFTEGSHLDGSISGISFTGSSAPSHQSNDGVLNSGDFGPGSRHGSNDGQNVDVHNFGVHSTHGQTFENTDVQSTGGFISESGSRHGSNHEQNVGVRDFGVQNGQGQNFGETNAHRSETDGANVHRFGIDEFGGTKTGSRVGGVRKFEAHNTGEQNFGNQNFGDYNTRNLNAHGSVSQGANKFNDAETHRSESDSGFSVNPIGPTVVNHSNNEFVGVHSDAGNRRTSVTNSPSGSHPILSHSSAGSHPASSSRPSTGTHSADHHRNTATYASAVHHTQDQSDGYHSSVSHPIGPGSVGSNFAGTFPVNGFHSSINTVSDGAHPIGDHSTGTHSAGGYSTGSVLAGSDVTVQFDNTPFIDVRIASGARTGSSDPSAVHNGHTTHSGDVQPGKDDKPFDKVDKYGESEHSVVSTNSANGNHDNFVVSQNGGFSRDHTGLSSSALPVNFNNQNAGEPDGSYRQHTAFSGNSAAESKDEGFSSAHVTVSVDNNQGRYDKPTTVGTGPVGFGPFGINVAGSEVSGRDSYVDSSPPRKTSRPHRRSSYGR